VQLTVAPLPGELGDGEDANDAAAAVDNSDVDGDRGSDAGEISARGAGTSRSAKVRGTPPLVPSDVEDAEGVRNFGAPTADGKATAASRARKMARAPVAVAKAAGAHTAATCEGNTFDFVNTHKFFFFYKR
jgi:hypothetical protein